MGHLWQANPVKFSRVPKALVQAPNIDVILVTELTRWGRSMLDLFHTLAQLPDPSHSSSCVALFSRGFYEGDVWMSRVVRQRIPRAM